MAVVTSLPGLPMGFRAIDMGWPFYISLLYGSSQSHYHSTIMLSVPRSSEYSIPILSPSPIAEVYALKFTAPLPIRILRIHGGSH
jgi:hypothetical protein